MLQAFHECSLGTLQASMKFEMFPISTPEFLLVSPRTKPEHARRWKGNNLVKILEEEWTGKVILRFWKFKTESQPNRDVK